MKKIITAINNPKLNEELKKENKFKIIGKDIQYREAILELLERNKDIDLIIISEQILGEIRFEYLIEKIKTINEKIKIIFILEKENEDLEKVLIEKNIINIYYNNQINLFELIKIINKNENNMEEEIIKLKKIIKENNINYNKLKNNKKTKYLNKKEKKDKINNNKFFNIKKRKIKKDLFKNKINDNKKQNIKNKKKLKKIITFSGTSKSGKSTLALTISKYLSKNKYKVLLVDADLEKQDLSIIINKYKKRKSKDKKVKIKKFNSNYFYNFNNLKNNKLNKNKINYLKIKNIIKIYTKKIENNFYFFYGLNILLKNNKNTIKKINIFFNNIINNYDFIIFELSKNNLDVVNKEILRKGNYNFVVFEANILEINEIKNLLNIYFNKWKIKKNNFQIILNKNNFFSINKKLISYYLKFKNKIHKIKENKLYIFFINNYFKKNTLFFKNKNIKIDVEKIIYEIKK